MFLWMPRMNERYATSPENSVEEIDMREKFVQELNELHKNFIQMLENAKNVYEYGFDYLVNQEVGDDEKIYAIRNEVNRLALHIEKSCNLIILKQQPVANDLKSIMLILESKQDVKRISDNAIHLMKLRENLITDDRFVTQLNTFHVILIKMLELLVASFTENSPSSGDEVKILDAKVDAVYVQIQAEPFLLEKMDATLARYEITLNKASRFLERIGDHIVNICDRLKQYT